MDCKIPSRERIKVPRPPPCLLCALAQPEEVAEALSFLHNYFPRPVPTLRHYNH